MNENHCYRKCKHFNNEVVCKALKKDQNCYQCIITSYEITISNYKKAVDKIKKLQEENERLKTAYGQCAWERDTILKELGYTRAEAFGLKEDDEGEEDFK